MRSLTFTAFALLAALLGQSALSVSLPRAGSNKSRPRHAYHQGHLRPALIEAAVALIERGGADALTLRDVARACTATSGDPALTPGLRGR